LFDPGAKFVREALGDFGMPDVFQSGYQPNRHGIVER
jgi:hypothetical protein